jgi:hypothetical protein
MSGAREAGSIDLDAESIDITAGVADGVDSLEFCAGTRRIYHPVVQATAGKMLLLKQLHCYDINSLAGHDVASVCFRFYWASDVLTPARQSINASDRRGKKIMPNSAVIERPETGWLGHRGVGHDDFGRRLRGLPL